MQTAQIPAPGASQHVILGDEIYAADARGTPPVRQFNLPLSAGIPAAGLMAALAQAGFDDAEPASFNCRGLSKHLPPDQVMDILQSIAGCAPGSSVVLDYSPGATHLWPASAGSMPRSHFKPRMLEHMLRHFGFRYVEHTGPARPGSAVHTIWATV